MDINNCTFTGRLGADAVVKTTPNGKSIMEMSVAVNSGYGDYKKTLWIKAKQFGDRVNNIVGIFKKGALVGFSGELDTDEWTGKDDKQHFDIVIKCQAIQVLHSKKADDEEIDKASESGDPVY